MHRRFFRAIFAAQRTTVVAATLFYGTDLYHYVRPCTD